MVDIVVSGVVMSGGGGGVDKWSGDGGVTNIVQKLSGVDGWSFNHRSSVGWVVFCIARCCTCLREQDMLRLLLEHRQIFILTLFNSFDLSG